MVGTVTSDPSSRKKGASEVASLAKTDDQVASRYTALVSTRRVLSLSAPSGMRSVIRSLVSPATQSLMAWRAASVAATKSTTRIPAP